MCRLLKQIIPASISFDLGFRNSLWQRHFPECAHTYFLKPNYREKQFCAKVTKTSSSVVSIASRLLYKALSVGLECSSLIRIVIFWNGIFRCLFKEMPFLWRYSLWPGAYQWGNVVMDCEWDGERQELSISWCSFFLTVHHCCSSEISGEILRNAFLSQTSGESSCALQNTREMPWLELKDKAEMSAVVNGKELVMGINQWFFFTVKQYRWCHGKQFW